MVQYGYYGSPSKHLFMLGGGYAAGTPLTYNDSVALVRAAAASPAEDVAALVSAAQLGAVSPEDNVQSACSRERPVVVDIGGGMGLSAAMAGARGRCGQATLLCRAPLTHSHAQPPRAA